MRQFGIIYGECTHTPLWYRLR